MRFRTLLLISFFTLATVCACAQSIVAFSAGISRDINNTRPFYILPITFRWEPFRHSGFFIESDYGIGFNRISNADAYTANVQLPEHVVLKEMVTPNTFSVGMGGSFVAYSNKKNNSITISFSWGIRREKYRVNYRNYDELNYEVLNPDVSEDKTGLYLSTSAIYSFHKSRQGMFIMLRILSPSSAKPGSSADEYYGLSYNSVAPLQLTFGYKLFYNKRK